MDKKKNKVNFSTILIIILSCIIIGLAAYIVVENNNHKSTPESNEKDSSRALTEIESKALMENIETLSLELATEYPIDSIDDIPNQKLLKTIYHISEVGYNNFQASVLDKYALKYFGNDKKIIKEDIICTIDNEPLLTYNAEEDKYTMNTESHGHGGEGFISRVKAFYVDGNIINDKTITINTKILYGNYCGDTCLPGYAYYLTVPVEGSTPIFASDDEGEFIVTEEKYNEISSKIPITTFTFERDDLGNYGLKSVKIK